MEKTRTELLAEIAQLKAELELTKKERDQAIEFAGIEVHKGGSMSAIERHRYKFEVEPYHPELYAHLAGKVEG